MSNDWMLRWWRRYELFNKAYYEMLCAYDIWRPDYEAQIVDGVTVGYAPGFNTEDQFSAKDKIRLAAWESVGGWVV